MKAVKGYFVLVLGALLIGSCSTTYYSSTRYADDLYATHDTRAIAEEAARQRQREYERARAAAEAAARVQSGQLEGYTGNPYDDILSDSYEESYERRLRGFQSPTYNMPSSYYNFRYSSEANYASAYDPAFYNVIIMGDQVWVEPKYITAMFGTWGAPSRVNINIGWGGWWGWNSPCSGYWGSPGWAWDPFWGWNCGWNSWNWGWANSPYFWGSGWGWGPRWGSSWGWGPSWGWSGHSGWRPGGGFTSRNVSYRPSFSTSSGTYRGSSGSRSSYGTSGTSRSSSSGDYRRSGSSSSSSSGSRSSSSGSSSGWGRSSGSSSSSSGTYTSPSRSGSSSSGSYESPSRSSGSSSSGGSSSGGSSSGGGGYRGGGGGNTRR